MKRKTYTIAKQYTEDMAGQDILVFLKTDFKHIGKDANGKKCVVRDDDNYVYAMFPKRSRGGKGVPSCEAYVKPHGSILTWKDKLAAVEASELDALSEDIPASWEEYSDLLTKLVLDHTVGDGVIVIEDATTWQKMGAARKRLYAQTMREIIDGTVGTEERERCGTVYPLALEN